MPITRTCDLVDAPMPEAQPSDPSSLTTEQLLRAISGERDYVDGKLEVVGERLAGIDRATELRLGGIIGIPAQIEEKVEHLRGVIDEQIKSLSREIAHSNRLADEKFTSVAKQFDERDTRSERESKDNKVAVDAAFAAQKEAAAKQDEANSKAINKSETATTETINKLSELFKTTTDALADKIEDLKDSTTRQIADLKEYRAGTQAGSASSKQSIAYAFTAIAAVTGLVGIALAILANMG